MILADKIIQLRKKNGWSQEELAEKVGVSRQSVSKWEGAQSVPDLDKILLIGNVFGVSTDYLLKDEIEMEEVAPEPYVDTEKTFHRISMEAANDYLSIKAITAKRIALGAFLCVLSPICLFLMAAGADSKAFALSEAAAVSIGMITLLLLVTVAVALFISSGMKTRPYEFMDTEPIELEYGVDGMVKERLKKFSNKYAISNILGACICILSVIPLFVGAALTETEFVLVCALCVMFFVVAIGVVFFITAGIIHESMQKLLQEGEYSKKAKKDKRTNEAVSSVFWLSATALYLAISFYTNSWDRTWIVWPVAGVLYAALMSAMTALKRNKK